MKEILVTVKKLLLSNLLLSLFLTLNYFLFINSYFKILQVFFYYLLTFKIKIMKRAITMKLFLGLLLSLLTVSGMNAAVTWTTFPFAAQTGSFVVEFDATPDSVFVDGVMALLNVEGAGGSAWSLMACSVRFGVTGLVEARNGGAFAAVTPLTYEAGKKYHVKMDINVTTHKYDVVVTPNGGAAVTIASNYSFRTEQAAIPQLQYFSRVVGSIATFIGDVNGVVLENLVIGGASIPTAISSISSSSFNVYPNPLASGSELTLDFGSKVNGNIEIFDIDGKLSYKSSIVDQSKTNIATSLKRGMYLMKINQGSTSYSQKIIVK